EVVMKRILLALCLIWTLWVPSNAAQREPTPTTPAVPDFIIGEQDVLAINVWREPDFTTVAAVRPDGKITLPLLDDIQAAGLTPTELAVQITSGFQKFVSEPLVTVVVVAIHSQYIHIIGLVRGPGTYDLGSPLTVVQLLSRAGGFTELARTRDVMIVRTEGG